MVRVKICGITNKEDALAAVEGGADALGFIFYKQSPRYILPEVAAEIISGLSPFVSKVGVFVDESAENIERIIRETRINIAQLHGHEPPETCQGLSVPVIKAFRVKDEASLAALPLYVVSALLLDSYVPGQPGGTGARFNWDLAIQAKSFGRPVILAGGLTPENVAEAVNQVQPYGLDVSSGVESAPGRKDHRKLRDFIQRAKGAELTS